MTESIAPALPRSFGPAERLPAAIAQRTAFPPDVAEADALRRTPAPTRGERSRPEDQTLRAREARQQGFTGVTYPPAGPRLPPPLIPIREIPPPDVRLLYQQPVDGIASQGPAPGATAADSTPGTELAEQAKSALQPPAERALEQIVFVQAREAHPTPEVDTSLAGQLFDVEV